jgi:HAD superfamily hydrolase (TIGR01509 family)
MRWSSGYSSCDWKVAGKGLAARCVSVKVAPETNLRIRTTRKDEAAKARCQPPGSISHRTGKSNRIIGMKLKIPEGDFAAYLFDCDGTIADSMPLHFVAWTKALGEWNCKFDERLFYAWGGRPTHEIIATLNEQQGLKMPVEHVADRKEQYYYESLPELKVVPEVLEHIEAQHGRIPFAVVSGSTRESVVASLESLGLTNYFQTLVCAGEYANSKPAPDAFLLAAEKLRVKPEKCLVFEDTEMGIQAARAAGMAFVKIPLPWERVSA